MKCKICEKYKEKFDDLEEQTIDQMKEGYTTVRFISLLKYLKDFRREIENLKNLRKDIEDLK